MKRHTTLLLALLLFLGACKKDEKRPASVNMFFVFPLTIKPAQETIARGDTLWVEASYSDSLLEIHSGKKFLVQPQDINPQLVIGFFQLVGKGSPARSAAPSYTVVNRIGDGLKDGFYVERAYDPDHTPVCQVR